MAFDKNNEEWDGSEHDEPWIKWFCGLKGHEMFCEVERSYIEDGFNLYGLRVCVSNFNDCLDLILDRIGPDEESDDSHLTQSACTLYGLIHARYIITAHGLDAMYNKYAAKEFGTCPLIQCGGQPVLPVSLKDEMGVDTVKIYCPKCSQVFHPPPIRSSRSSSSLNSNINNNNALTASSAGGGITGSGAGMTTTTIQSGGADGAAFGTTFPHLFLMTFSNLVPDPLPADSVYVPRIFGFRIHKSTTQSQQQRQQQQQRFLPSPTTATTTNTSNTQNTLPAAVSNAQIQQNQMQQESVVTANQSIVVDDMDDNQINLTGQTGATDDRKLPAVRELDDEENDDDDGDDDNNSQFNQQTSMGVAVIPDSETAVTVPSLLALEENEIVNDSTAATVKRIRDMNGAPPEASSAKRRRRTTSSSNNT